MNLIFKINTIVAFQSHTLLFIPS